MYMCVMGRFGQDRKFRKLCVAAAAMCACFIALFVVIKNSEAPASEDTADVFSNKENSAASSFPTRKLLQSNDDNDDDGGDANRIGAECSKNDIVIFQGTTNPLPNGIPSFTVQILNVCVSGCSISDIHVKCGWFSSARLVNPRVFRRVYFDDCIVNNGEPLAPGEALSFQYANSFRYPLTVSSVACC